MEADLARLADMVIIVAESSGTFAELGAFSLSDNLRKKILAFVDRKYEHTTDSFLATGPLRWIGEESVFAPPIFAPLDSVLDGAAAFEERLSRIPKKAAQLESLSSSPVHQMLFICDLIAIIGPTTTDIVDNFMSKIIPQPSEELGTATLTGLAAGLGMIAHKQIAGTTYFYAKNDDALMKPFHHPYKNNLASLRSDFLSGVSRIVEFQEIVNNPGE
jgi:hypothetical protein